MLIFTVAAGSIIVGVWMISGGSSGLAFILTGILLSIAGAYQFHVAKAKFPTIKVPTEQTMLFEWQCTREEIVGYVAFVKRNAKSNLPMVAGVTFLIMLFVGNLLFDTFVGMLVLSLIIPIGILLGFISQQFQIKKWNGSDGKIIIKNSSINMFGTEIKLISANHQPVDFKLLDSTPTLLQIDLKYSGRYARIIPTYIPVPAKNRGEAYNAIESWRGLV